MSNTKHPTPVTKAPEVAMHDVMQGRLKAATCSVYQPAPVRLQILSCEASRTAPCTAGTPKPRQIHRLTTVRSHDVVDFLIRRELELERLSA